MSLRPKSKKITGFSKNVIYWVKKIPRGKIATYGQIARLAGKPQSARAVGWLLHSSSGTYRLPWQRVINSQGKISFPWGTKNHSHQKKLLQSDGVYFIGTDRVNLKEFQWKKK